LPMPRLRTLIEEESRHYWSTAEVTDAWAVTRTMAKPLCSLRIRLKDEPVDEG
jgi:hypothetical protein